MSNSLVNATHQLRTGDYSNLIGIPYEVLDCWGIVREFYSLVYGASLQSYYTEIPKDREIAKSLILSSMKDFECVLDRKFGDVVLIKLYGVESHIAVYLGEEKILHTNFNTGCVIENIGRWEKLIVGFYRVKQ